MNSIPTVLLYANVSHSDGMTCFQACTPLSLSCPHISSIFSNMRTMNSSEVAQAIQDGSSRLPVIFDMGGVLLRGGTMCAGDESGIFNKLSALGGPPRRSARSVWHQVMQATETGAMPEAYAWEQLAANSSRLGASEIRSLIMDDVYPVPAAIELLRKVKESGHTTAIASNHYESWMAHWIRKYPEMFTLVDHVYFSQNIGHRKPSEEFFKSVLKSLNVKRGWFIDDRRENCVAAAQCGLTAVYFQDDRHCEIISPLDVRRMTKASSSSQLHHSRQERSL